MIAAHLRNPNTEAKDLMKLIALQSKLAGWDKKKEDKPTEGTNINKLLLEIERKRKEARQI